MDPKKSEEEKLRLAQLNDFLANERTFLAWIRTSIGMMAFGFVVEKFALFLKQFSFYLESSAKGVPPELPPELRSSSIFGLVLVGMGALIGFLSYIKYKRVERQIREQRYQQRFILEVMVMLSVFAIGVFLFIYLFHSL